MKKKLFTTPAIFRCVIKFKNGFHKTIRMTIDKVATLNAAIKQVKEIGLLNRRYLEFFQQMEVNGYDVDGCRIINERTGELFLSL